MLSSRNYSPQMSPASAYSPASHFMTSFFGHVRMSNEPHATAALNTHNWRLNELFGAKPAMSLRNGIIRYYSFVENGSKNLSKSNGYQAIGCYRGHRNHISCKYPVKVQKFRKKKLSLSDEISRLVFNCVD